MPIWWCNVWYNQTSLTEVSSGRLAKVNEKPLVVFVHFGSKLNSKETDWNFTMDVNTRSMYLMIHPLIGFPLPFLINFVFSTQMLAKKSGTILNNASMAQNQNVGVTNRCVYSTSNAAVIGLTKSGNFIEQGIRCVCPGNSLRQAMTEDAGSADILMSRNTGRMCTSEEVVHLCVYLTSDEVRSVNFSLPVVPDGRGLLNQAQVK
uniref:Dehydrogenase/reductase SDR family member 6 n=1 Tax=Salmo trutta TaxID=8032 RepID=A0A674E346_SALTR